MALVHCRECGEMISESAPTCPKCGAKQLIETNDFWDGFKGGSTGLKVLSFLLPLVGLILFLVKMDSDRPAAKAYGLWALAGFILGIFITLLL